MARLIGGPHRGHAAGNTDVEKAASQLVSDIKYKARKKLGKDTHANPAQVAKLYLQLFNASDATGPVKAIARKKLFGPSTSVTKEDFDNGAELATKSVANALYKVFVEGVKNNEEIQLNYINELYSRISKTGERLYHIIVTDKKTGNTYTRDATREKIAELRANPNIASVEMSERQLDTEKEKTKGVNTARVKAGKGLDPVGKEDSDPDNDGKHNDPNDKYIMKRRAAIGKAIAKRKEVAEEFIGEVNNKNLNPDANNKTIDVMKGENIVKINPEIPGSVQSTRSSMQLAHYEADGSFIVEKSISKGHQRFLELVNEKMNLATANMGDVIGDFETSNAPQFKGKSKEKRQQMAIAAKLEAERQVKESSECGCDDQPVRDKRGDFAKVAMVKNKLRAMGMKNPVVMVASEQHRPPAGWKPWGGGSDDTPTVKIDLRGVEQAGPDGRVPPKDKPVRQASSKSKGTNKTA